MNIITSTVNATGGWFRANKNADVAIACSNASVFDGATVAIQFGNEANVVLNQSADRNYTAGFDDILSLKEGMHVRAVITGAGASTIIVVDAFPATGLDQV